jgi:hypothetical protein
VKRALAGLCLVLSLCDRSPAGLIASRNLDGKGGVASTILPIMSLGFGDGASNLDVEALSTANPAGLYTIDGANPAFAQVSVFLTNGSIDWVNLCFTSGGNMVGLGVGNEALTFYGDGSGALGIDFAGRQIDAITFQVGAYYTRFNPAHNFVEVAIYSTLRIYGSGSPLVLIDDPARPVPTLDEALPAPPVPEPSTLALGGLGALGLALARRRLVA